MNPSAAEIVARLELLPHPEGGYFRESYRAAGEIPGLGRSHSTAIYYLIEGGDRSKLHRIKSDEIWHFYFGDPIVIAEIDGAGSVTETVLGQDLSEGQLPQHVVPAGRWFGAFLPKGEGYALVGCTVAPGFDFADFEMGKKDELFALYPKARELIDRLS